MLHDIDNDNEVEEEVTTTAVKHAYHELFPAHWHRRVVLSTYATLLMVFILGYMSFFSHGFSWMVRHWLGPYLVVNCWLVGYTWLQHTHPAVPHFGDASFTWLRGALSTVDRPYPWIYDALHHHIGTTHVLHHLNFKIPHYHAVE